MIRIQTRSSDQIKTNESLQKCSGQQARDCEHVERGNPQTSVLLLLHALSIMTSSDYQDASLLFIKHVLCFEHADEK